MTEQLNTFTIFEGFITAWSGVPLQSIEEPIRGKAKGEGAIDVSDCVCFGRRETGGFWQDQMSLWFSR